MSHNLFMNQNISLRRFSWWLFLFEFRNVCNQISQGKMAMFYPDRDAGLSMLMAAKMSLCSITRTSLVAQMVQNLPAMQETQVRSLSGTTSGEGNGNPLQYCCLENSKDRGVSLNEISLTLDIKQVSCDISIIIGY